MFTVTLVLRLVGSPLLLLKSCGCIRGQEQERSSPLQCFDSVLIDLIQFGLMLKELGVYI